MVALNLRADGSMSPEYTAKSSAIIYSIVETAKANNLKPFDYVQYLLEEIPRHTDEKECSFLENLLPWSGKLPVEIRKA